MTKSQDKQVTGCICGAQSAKGDGEHWRWKQTGIWPCSNLEEWRLSHSAHTLSQSQQENQQLIQNAYKSLSVRSWVRLFILGTAITQPNEWIKWIHSTAENLDTKPGWSLALGFSANSLSSAWFSHAGNMFEQSETLDHILDQLKKIQFKGTEYQIIFFNISNYAFVIRRPSHHSLFK